MVLNFNHNAIFYHGTVNLFGDILKKKGIKIFTTAKHGLDFGSGFYLSQANRSQAAVWAKIRANSIELPSKEMLDWFSMSRAEFINQLNQLVPVVLSFRIKNPEEWVHFNHKTFSKVTLNWKEYVYNCRNNINAKIAFDTTFGPVADGGINSGYTHKIEAYPNYTQLAIHQQNVADLFEIINIEEV